MCEVLKKNHYGRQLVGRSVIIFDERAHTDDVTFLIVFVYKYRTQ